MDLFLDGGSIPPTSTKMKSDPTKAGGVVFMAAVVTELCFCLGAVAPVNRWHPYGTFDPSRVLL